MRRWLMVLVVGFLTGCGTTTTTETVTASSPATAPAAQPADPSMSADCQPQPNRPPICTQGNYQVQPPQLGSTCDAAGDVWEWNEQYQGVGGGPYTAVCAKRDPAHLPG